MKQKTCIYILAFIILSVESKIFRNNNIISHYQNGNRNSVESTSAEKQEKHARILLTMQNVLCKNFPKVPCNLITQDETLRNLIGQSIAQMNYKTSSLVNKQKNTHVIDSEELSSYLTVKHTGYFTNEKEIDQKKKNKTSKKNNNGFITGRKQIKKFYPHKYKEVKKEASKEKVNSISDEFPEIASLPHKRTGPIWHIDYTKQGEPSFSKYKKSSHGYTGRRGKEVFIKKSFVRNDED